MTTEPQTAAHCPGCHGYIEPKYLLREPCPGIIEREARSGLDAGLREALLSYRGPLDVNLPIHPSAVDALSDRVDALAAHIRAALSSGEAAPVDGLPEHGDHPRDSYLYDGCPGCEPLRSKGPRVCPDCGMTAERIGDIHINAQEAIRAPAREEADDDRS